MNCPGSCRLRLAIILGLLAATSLPGANANAEPTPSQGLGRLFITPQKRAVLEQLRLRNALITPDQRVDSFLLNGIVRRSQGPSTVWVNGISFHQRYPVAALGTRSARIFAGDGRTIELNVGEEISISPTDASAGSR